MTTTQAYLASSYAVGDPAAVKIEIPAMTCRCGGRLDPLVGRVLQSMNLRWDVWAGAYEHTLRPATVHVIEPVAEWVSA